MHRGIHNLGRVAAILAMGSAVLVAQGTQTASITGDVVDGGGAPVAAARIRLTSPSLQGVRALATDDHGHFVARLLPPGVYTIEIVKDGFITAKVTEKLMIDQNYQPRFVMAKVSGTTVEVVGSTPAVDKTDVKTAVNYSMDQINLLPQAKTPEGAALLTPGVTTGVGGRTQIRGAMTSGNLMLVDGQNVEDNAYGNRGVNLIAEAMEETQVITGAISAEYGNVEGGVMNTITRSGSNTFTGQIRWDLTNPQWNAMAPYDQRSAVSNKLADTKTYSVGGYFWKDHIWFYASYYRASTSGVGAIAAPLGDTTNGGFGSSYATGQEEIRRQAKLTIALSPDHSLVYSWMNSQNDQINRNYSAGELAALVPQHNESKLWSLSLRSTWTPSITSEVRFGKKHQLLAAGGSGTQDPIYNYDVGYYYNNGIFNSQDGGDARDNKSFNAKVSIFFDALGSHQLDTGLDYYKGIRKARNDQSPTSEIVGVSNMNLTTRVAEGADIWLYTSTLGEADSISTGLYVNDKWTLNTHWAFQIGLRWDNYKAENESGSKTASANGISPRLGVTYDLLGDSKYVFKVSAARYNGKVLEGITTQVTGQGNPIETDHAYTGPAGQQPFSVLQNHANYDMTQAGVTYYNNPAVNVKLGDGMKAPHVDELQASAAYSFNSEYTGTGFVRVTGVYKKWSDLIDYSIGNAGHVTDAYGQDWYVKLWNNNPDAKRMYRDLELEVQSSKGPWQFTYNATWSTLKGNYEGEGSSTPARGEGINAWNVIDGQRVFDNSMTAPYGYLTGHEPLRMNAQVVYTLNSALGKTDIGLIYRFDSATHYSLTRNVKVGGVSPLIPSGQAGKYLTQYYNNQRGQFENSATSYMDLAINHEWELGKVVNTPVKAFARVAIGNIWNHQQIAGPSVATGTAATPASVWVVKNVYNSSACWGTPRTYTVAGGIRF